MGWGGGQDGTAHLLLPPGASISPTPLQHQTEEIEFLTGAKMSFLDAQLPLSHTRLSSGGGGL